MTIIYVQGGVVTNISNEEGRALIFDVDADPGQRLRWKYTNNKMTQGDVKDLVNEMTTMKEHDKEYLLKGFLRDLIDFIV